MVVHASDVITLVQNWASVNIDRIKKVYKVNGGWEKWAQIEMATYLNINAELGGRVFREVPAFTNAMSKADLFISSWKETEWKSLLVELKCYNIYLDLINPDGRFVDEMWKDVLKAQNRATDWQNYDFLVIGLVIGTEIAQRVHNGLQKKITNNRSWGALEAVPGSGVWILFYLVT